MPNACEQAWRRRSSLSPLREVVSFEPENLVLGSGTVLRKLAVERPGTVSLYAGAAHDRMVALLAIAGRGRLAKGSLLQLETALEDWQRGNRGLAAIRLAFASLPRVRDQDDGYRLFLAEMALDAGLRPGELLKEVGHGDCLTLLKGSPNQPRVPHGSGRRSGQWTSGETEAAPDDARPPSPTQIFFDPKKATKAQISMRSGGAPGSEKPRKSTSRKAVRCLGLRLARSSSSRRIQARQARATPTRPRPTRTKSSLLSPSLAPGRAVVRSRTRRLAKTRGSLVRNRKTTFREAKMRLPIFSSMCLVSSSIPTTRRRSARL